jgi:NAD(P)-dependent dehydrogenase (short-subunit alcohol dehydrogenase family)
MVEKGLAVITGANGDIGREITSALAKEGYRIIMACRNMDTAGVVCKQIKKETANQQIEVRKLDLASLTSVYSFAERLLKEKRPVDRLINNAGILTTPNRQTEEGVETIIAVNYISPYLLTRRLLPLMRPQSRIINLTSLMAIAGKIESGFFITGMNKSFNRFIVYANSKLGVMLFTQELAKRIENKGITVNACDPGIVNTRILTLQSRIDPLVNLFFRPFIKSPVKGAQTLIFMALSEQIAGDTGKCFARCKEKKLPQRIANHHMQEILWCETDRLLLSLGFDY